jgi:tetratricopeptide (TPR) repeat protein
VLLKEDFYEAYYNLAVAYAATCSPARQLEQAIAAAERASRAQPDNPQMHRLLAELYLQVGDEDQALMAAQAAQQADANAPETYSLLATIYTTLGRDAEAQAMQRQANALWQQAVALPGATTVDALLALGDAARTAGANDDALAHYQAAQQVVPTDPRVQLGLGQTYYNQGDYELAVRAFQTWLQAAPRDGVAHLLLGIVYQKQDKASEATAAIKQAIQFLPCEAAPHTALAHQYWQQNDLVGYEQELRAALALAPQDPLLLYSLGTAAMINQRMDEAEQFYVKALESKHPFAEASLGLGEVYFSQGDYARAAVAWEQALTTLPTDTVAYAPYAAALGQAYTLQERWDDAIAAYQRALAVQETSEVHHALGLVYTALQKDELAVAEFTRALELEPDHAAARQALEEARTRLNQ